MAVYRRCKEALDWSCSCPILKYARWLGISRPADAFCHRHSRRVYRPWTHLPGRHTQCLLRNPKLIDIARQILVRNSRLLLWGDALMETRERPNVLRRKEGWIPFLVLDWMDLSRQLQTGLSHTLLHSLQLKCSVIL